MIQWGSRARPPRLQSGQAPLSRALPRTGPRSCLAARVRREVDTAPTCSSILLGVSPERPPCFLLLTQLRRPLCAIKFHRGRSFFAPELSLPTSPSSPQSIAPPSASANPPEPSIRSVLLQPRPKRRRGRSTVTSFAPRLSSAASCSVEVAVSSESFCVAQFALYSPGAAGVCSAEAAVRRARGRGG